MLKSLRSPEVLLPQKSIFTPRNGRSSNLILMPTEVVLMIASELPPNARTLLALTCKGFFNVLTPLLGLKLPAEQPSNIQESSMSEPQLYQPERWRFLRLLEKDLFDKWQLCFDCFILHPVNVFVKPKTSLVPWLKNYGGLLQNPPRNCRHLSHAAAAQDACSHSPRGVIDVCPCHKLTPGKKRRVLTKLRTLEQSQDNQRWWHMCRHIYGDITLEIKLGFISFGEDAELGLVIDYKYVSPSDSSSVSPRMLCPHIALDTLIKTFSQCRELHSEHIVCTRCKELQHCKICHSTLFRFIKATNSTSAMTSYTVSVERQLTAKLWNEHTIFPFAGKRQHDSMKSWSGWKLW